ncbi:putative secondary metabolism biosynthetic enzyme [Paraconiothyrium brasiliense]|uniref:Secondary metabolism biosynthetic enzyme n=1 Tax=Paraconiothyrium brasiliense TaxID=300254 RepID=A0ABR3R0Y3_9PLEO
MSDYSIWDFNGGGRFYTVFPYFHLAGFLSLLVNPIFTEASSPVLGPPLMPPSGSLLKEVMRHQSLRALYLPPSIAEQLLLEPGGLDFFRGLDFLAYTGAPFSPSAGEQLSKVTELCPLYGSTEAFQVPQLVPSPEDWAWMEWNPHFKVEMQPSPDDLGAFELVLFADESTKTMSALNHNMRGLTKYRTRDLFKQHPEKTGLWQYYGRKDDIIVLSNGEKFNPVPLELATQGHPALAGALIIGQGRSRASLLVEPKAGLSTVERTELVDAIWPRVDDANRLLPAQGRILRGNVIVSQLDKPFTRAGKGTIVRKLTEDLYKSVIDELYANETVPRFPGLPRLQATMKPHFETGAIINFVRGIIKHSFPDLSGIQDNDDLFSCGLDSVMIGQFLSNLKGGLKDSTTTNDLSWIDNRLVYRNSSISRLSNILYHFLSTGDLPKQDTSQSRVSFMEDLVEKYSQGLVKLSTLAKENCGPKAVALVGSTGYLGPHILIALLNNPGIASIYCLNRSADARERTRSALQSGGYQENEGFRRLNFFVSDLAAPNLGLSESDFDEVSSKVDTIIYNSWRPDFSIPVLSFEKPFLLGLRNVIDWAANSTKRPRIVFISSIAAVGNWSKVFPSQAEIPEALISDASVAMHMGYGESKCVGERILQVAHDVCEIPVNIIRVGQIGGHGMTPGGKWPVQRWLLAIIRTSKALGALPTQVAPVDWIPVDALATQISDVVASSSTTVGYHIINMVHPDVAPWDLFLDTLHNRFGVDAKRISLPEWLELLLEKARLDSTGQKKYVALKFSDFLRSMGDGREDMKIRCENIAKVSQMHIAPLTEDLLAEWLKTWEL